MATLSERVAGRPKGDSDARSRLIHAALQLFGSRSFATVSTRELARQAEVDAAMIRYYFGSKTGLFESMVRETLAPVLANLRDMSASAAPSDLASLMQTYYQAMAPNPALPRLIVRVLQEPEHSEPQRILLNVFADVMELSRQWLARALINSGSLRDEVNPELARLSLVSLMVFPLIAPPVLMQQFGFSGQPNELAQLVAHNISVLQHGLLKSSDSEDA
ncbi:TetR/AcrR family transcriptional regulator [Motilimonas cestriensis]|uniref:TetR/AcrR family transcriptional regulator n=1 Tax=Motilimonas cestriensis TaxID=2742685 RepID=UPI003DA28DF1